MEKDMKSKRKKKNIRKFIFSIIVILIVLAFGASFFSSALSSRTAAATPTPMPEAPVPSTLVQPTSAPTPTPTPTVDYSAFLASIKTSMVVKEDAAENAILLTGAINVYNSLYPDKMVLSGDDMQTAGIEKLTEADIYFDEITEEAENAAWALVTIDENGKATAK